MIRDAIVLADPGEIALRKVAGVPLVKRALLVLARAGVMRAYVVGDAAIAGAIADDRDLAATGLAIEVCPPSDLAHVRDQLAGPCLLARADHVFDVTIAKLGAATTLTGERTSLVAATGEEVGLSVIAPSAVSAAVPPATATIFVPADAVWHRAETPALLRAAEDVLFDSLRKRTDGPVSRHLNRPMSLFVTRRLVRTNITPNQMTIVANLIGALGVILVFQGTWTTLAIGALLVHAQSVLDGCDGEIARLKFRSSRLGEWLDNVLDDQVNIGYGIGLGFAATALTGQDVWRWIGLAGGIAFFLHNLAFYAQLAFVHRSGNPFLFRWWFEKPGVDVTAMLAAPTLGSRLGAAARSLIRRDLFLFAFLLLCLVHLPQIAALWYGAVAASQFIVMGLHLLHGGAPAASRAAAAR